MLLMRKKKCKKNICFHAFIAYDESTVPWKNCFKHSQFIMFLVHTSVSFTQKYKYNKFNHAHRKSLQHQEESSSNAISDQERHGIDDNRRLKHFERHVERRRQGEGNRRPEGALQCVSVEGKWYTFQALDNGYWKWVKPRANAAAAARPTFQSVGFASRTAAKTTQSHDTLTTPSHYIKKKNARMNVYLRWYRSSENTFRALNNAWWKRAKSRGLTDDHFHTFCEVDCKNIIISWSVEQCIQKNMDHF